MKLVSSQQLRFTRKFLEFLNPQAVSRVVLYKLHCTEQTLNFSGTRSQFLEHYCEAAESFIDLTYPSLILRDANWSAD